MEQTSISNLNTKSTVDDNDYLVIDDLSSTNKILAKTILDACKSELLAKLYPVGSIYMSVNSTSPATLFGGTWEQIKDTFLLGSGSYTLGATGGSKTHTHKYGLWRREYNNACGGVRTLSYNEDNTYTVNSKPIEESSLLSLNGSTSDTIKEANGYIQSYISTTSYENTLPPYLVVNIWKRTA